MGVVVFALGSLVGVAPSAAAPIAATPASSAPDLGFLTGPADGEPIDIAWRYLRGHLDEYGLTSVDVDDVVVTDRYTDSDTGVTHIYMRQRSSGIEVADGNLSVNIARDGSVINLHSAFVGGLAEAVNTSTPGSDAEEGVQKGAAAVGLDAPADLTVIRPSRGPDQATSFKGGELSQDPIPAKLVYVRDGESVRLAWSVRINETGGEHWWDVSTDAVTGAELKVVDFVDHETSSHNVYPLPMRSPSDGPRVAVTSPADPVASPFGWNDTDGVAGAEDTRTIGNNVHASTDVNADNVPDAGSEPDGGASLDFDFPADLTQDPSTYRPFAVSNLYYWNNTAHDVLHGYGFDEASGNFQVNNYGRGGVGADAVNAEDQDGSGTNNANFATPPDGQSPRMQMFVWSGAPFRLTVNAPASVAGPYSVPSSQFGSPGSVTGDVDLPAGSSLGCNAGDFAGFTAGAIALIDRGTCSFSTKVRNAQNAGATGVIIANNVAGTIGINQDGTPDQPTIRAVSVSQADGIKLKAEVATLNATIDIPPALANRDSSLDAEIVVHEYAHGVSNRLTGGPSNVGCLGNTEQMGEGWSDFLALALTQPDATTVTRGVGTYSQGAPPSAIGIRPTQYATNMAINPSTYDSIKTAAVPHGVGYVWATMLWDLYWRLAADHGFNANVRDAASGGNNLALALVMDGMKLQPCSPGFVNGRDAILLGDAARTGGANQCAIWETFARRGLGVGASQGSSSSVADGTQAFDVPAGVCGGPRPDLVTTGSLPPTGLLGGSPVVATLHVTNDAAVPASAAKLALSPTSGLVIQSSVPSAGSCATPASCAFGTLAAGASVDVTVTMRAIAQGSQRLTASASLTGVDAESANDSSTLDVAVYGTGTLREYSTDDNCTVVDAGTINCPLAVPDTGPALNTQVFIRIDHTFDSDLDISAVAPDGTTVLLSDDNGAGDDNYGTGPDPCSSGTTVPTSFADAAATPVVGAAAPFAGTFRPEGSLAVFDGHERGGTWNLRVTDDAATDVGTVLCWGIRTTAVAPPTTSSLTYTGATTVQYSDPAVVTARLADPASEGIPGETVALAYGTQTGSATTDASGDATAPIVITQAPGPVNASASFAGNVTTDVLPASVTAPATVAREDCTVGYSGDTNVTAGSPTNLAAQFGEDDADPGDWAGKSVVFTVTNADLSTQTVAATTNAAGVATTSATLGPKVHSVGVAFAGDTYYNPCSTVVDTRGSVNGTIASSVGGTPVSGAYVRLYAQRSLKSAIVYSRVTNAAGAYDLTGVAPGTYHLLAGKSGAFYTAWAPNPVVVGFGSTQTVDQAIAPGASGSATITSLSGPVPLATVRVMLNGKATANRVETDAAGHYALSGMTAGTYTLSVTAYGYQVATSAPFTVTAAGFAPAPDVELTRAPTRTIAGTLTNQTTGAPIRGAKVRLFLVNCLCGTNAVIVATTAANGTYTLPDVPAGLYTVQVSHAGFGPNGNLVPNITVTGGASPATLDLRRTPATGALTGTYTT